MIQGIIENIKDAIEKNSEDKSEVLKKV